MAAYHRRVVSLVGRRPPPGVLGRRPTASAGHRRRGLGAAWPGGHRAGPGGAPLRWLRGLVGLVAVVLVLPWGPAALAHDRVVATSPAAGSEQPEPPARVAVTFSSDVIPISPFLVVLGEGGVPVQDAPPTTAGPVLSTPLPADLATGTYTVRWRVVAQDGHPIEGSFTFRVGASGSSPSPSTPTSAPGADVPPAVVTEATTPSAPGSSLPLGLGAAVLAAALALAVAVVVRRRGTPTARQDGRRGDS
jgi:methionine-rich copper-binding protein CopC